MAARKPSPPGKVPSEARRMRAGEQLRTTLHLDECSIPSSVCSASRRSHHPPTEGFLADEGIGPYDLLPAFQRKILAQGKI